MAPVITLKAARMSYYFNANTNMWYLSVVYTSRKNRGGLLLVDVIERILYLCESNPKFVPYLSVFNIHSHTPEQENPRFLRQVWTRLYAFSVKSHLSGYESHATYEHIRTKNSCGSGTLLFYDTIDHATPFSSSGCGLIMWHAKMACFVTIIVNRVLI